MPWAARELDRRREVGGGPTRALPLLGTRARPAAAPSRWGYDDAGPGCPRWTSRSGTTTAQTRRTGSSCRSSPPRSCSVPYKPGAYRVGVRAALHEHCHRHSLPRRRQARQRLLRDRAHPRCHRRRTRTRPRGGPELRNPRRPTKCPTTDQLDRSRTACRSIYDSGDFPASLDKLMQLIGWDVDDGRGGRSASLRSRATGRWTGLLCRGHRARS